MNPPLFVLLLMISVPEIARVRAGDGRGPNWAVQWNGTESSLVVNGSGHERCFEFSSRLVTVPVTQPNGRPNYAFYSPRYPGMYASNADCIRLITAPTHHFIVLDFRDKFSVEQGSHEGCEYDFLEVRDGPYGFSPLVGKFCGHNIPRAIVSRTRFLWLRFVSDQAIEYEGFHLVYYFVNITERLEFNTSWMMEKPGDSLAELCLTRLKVEDWSSGNLASSVPAYVSANAATLQLPVDCVFELEVSNAAARLFIHIDEVIVPSGESCSFRFIELYDHVTSESYRRRHLCSADATPSYKSFSNRVFFRVFTQNLHYLPRFSFSYTVFHESPCDSSVYDCGDRTCINASLVCDGRANCDHQSDELRCLAGQPSAAPETSFESAAARRSRELKLHLFVVSLISALLGVLAAICAFFKCKRRQKRIDEYQAVFSRQTSTQTDVGGDAAGNEDDGETTKSPQGLFAICESVKVGASVMKNTFDELPVPETQPHLGTINGTRSKRVDISVGESRESKGRPVCGPATATATVTPKSNHIRLETPMRTRGMQYPKPPPPPSLVAGAPPPVIPPPPPPPAAVRRRDSPVISSPINSRSISLSSLLKDQFRRSVSRSQSQNGDLGQCPIPDADSPPYSLAYSINGYANFLQKFGNDASVQFW